MDGRDERDERDGRNGYLRFSYSNNKNPGMRVNIAGKEVTNAIINTYKINM